MLQHLGRLRPLQDAVLAEAEEAFKDVLGDREADDELLPWEERAVEEARKALGGQEPTVSGALLSLGRSYIV